MRLYKALDQNKSFRDIFVKATIQKLFDLGLYDLSQNEGEFFWKTLLRKKYNEENSRQSKFISTIF